MKYKLTAYRADNTVIEEREFSTFNIDQVVIVRLSDDMPTDVNAAEIHAAFKRTLPDRYVLLVSASIEIMSLEPIIEGHGSSFEITCSCMGQSGRVPHDPHCPAHPNYDLGGPV